MLQRHVLYLGEINSSQERAWRKSIEVFDEREGTSQSLALKLWAELGLDDFWGEHLPRSHKGTRWDQVLFVLVAYRLIAPGAEWRLYRQWYAVRSCSTRSCT